MSMWSNISQLKQSLTDEFQQSKRPVNDPISTIERNASMLRAEPANVDDIVSSLGGTDVLEKPDGNSHGAEKPITIAEPQQPSDPVPPDKMPLSEGPSPSKEPKPISESQYPEKNETSNPKTIVDPNQNESTSKLGNSETTSHLPPPSLTISRASSPAQNTKDVSPSQSLDPSVEAKLAKFAKYESMYPRLLKAYKEEKKRTELVKLYEKVLSEHTPCKSVAEPQALVDYINELRSKSDLQNGEISKLTSEGVRLNGEIVKLKKDGEVAKRDISRLTSELDKANSDLKQLSESQNKQQSDVKIDGELKAKVESLEAQLRLAEQKRDASVLSLTSTRSQLEELNTRWKETLAEADSLRDELSDAERISQERLRELSTLKDIMRNREKDDRASVNKTDSQLESLMADKEILESEVEVLNKRIVRESEQLQMQIKSLRSRLTESEAHEDDLRKQLIAYQESQSRARQDSVALKSTNSTESLLKAQEINYTAESQNHALSDARAAVANATRANELLKQVNKDNTLRVEKLQRSQKALVADLEQLRHENSLLRRRAIPAIPSSPNTTGPETTEDREKQQAYLKNVLLGFIQHKDQRKALMPVIATLLDLKNSESEKFMNGFA